MGTYENSTAADVATLLARLTALRAGYLDELDFDLTARLGTPAGASLAADLLVIDNFVDDLETAVGAIEGATTLHNKLTAARAALLDQISAARLAELDAANLPADIDTIKGYTDSLEGAVGAIEGATTLHAKLTAARAALLDEITAVRLAELSAANLPADIDTLLTRLSALRAGYLDNLSGGAVALAASWTAALATALGNYTAARAGYLDELAAANIPADVDKIPKSDGTVSWNATALAAIQTEAEDALAATASKRLTGRPQVFQKAVTSAANAGDVTLVTVTTQAVVIDSIVVKAVTAAQADLTSAAVAGGASKVVVFLSATDAAKANIDAVDEQVAWTGAAELAAAKTIVMTLTGTGATAVNLLVTFTFHAVTDGGYLA